MMFFSAVSSITAKELKKSQLTQGTSGNSLRSVEASLSADTTQKAKLLGVPKSCYHSMNMINMLLRYFLSKIQDRRMY